MLIRKMVPACFAISALLSCSSDASSVSGNKNDSVADTAIQSVSLKSAVKRLTLEGISAFYVLNSRSAGSPDSAKLNAWLDPFLDSVIAGGIDTTMDLLRNGGGPMGAQIDPAADILVLSCMKEQPDEGSVNFMVNGFPSANAYRGVEQLSNGRGWLCWYLVPLHSVNVMRHPATPKEIETICNDKGMSQDQWMKNSCTVIRFTIDAKVKGKEVKKERYLLVSYS